MDNYNFKHNYAIRYNFLTNFGCTVVRLNPYPANMENMVSSK